MSPENLPLPDSGLATQGDSLVQCANVQSFSLEEKQELLLVMQHGKRRIKLGHSSLIHSRFPVEQWASCQKNLGTVKCLEEPGFEQSPGELHGLLQNIQRGGCSYHSVRWVEPV